MPSLVWARDAEEAFGNPYEYAAQDQFVREAQRAIDWLQARINPPVRRFGRDERSLEKALWMLRVDVIDTLGEALLLLSEKRHRMVGRVFRDIVEVADLAFVMSLSASAAAKWLTLWYENAAPHHHDVRKSISRLLGPEYAAVRTKYYGQLSKFTHRSYRALLTSYSVGQGDTLVHDSWSPGKVLVLPHTISSFYAILADLVAMVVAQFAAGGALSTEDVTKMWTHALESETVPRHFDTRVYTPPAP